MRVIFLLMSLFILMTGCSLQNNQGEHSEDAADKDHDAIIAAPTSHDMISSRQIMLDHASGFEITDYESFCLLTVFNPWQHSQRIRIRYILAEDPAMVPDSLRHLSFIKVPVKRVVAFSTTHIACIDTLVGISSIAGISGPGYVYNPRLRREIESGRVRDVGFKEGMNYELLVDLQPDVIFLYGVESSIESTMAKLMDLRLPTVMCGDYLESHPLGKAEWIRFFGEFYGVREKAERIYRGIDSAYHGIVEKTNEISEAPRVLSGLPWKNTWYLPGGASFAATLIADAGGSYLWEDDTSKEALPYDLEAVFLRAIEAEIWINPGDAGSMASLLATDERFRDLPVFSSGHVFNNNLRLNPDGGNDYWESGTLRPDLVLSDLFAIFHPSHSDNHTFTYYKKLK